METKYNKCPLCATPKSVKSKRGNLIEFKDKQGTSLIPSDYDLIVLDECHYIKNEAAKRTKVIKKAFKDVPRKILISGTPIKSRPMEFFSILNFLRPEEFNSSHEFGKKYGAGYQDTFGWKYDGASNLEELFGVVQPYFLRRLKSDVLELPPKTFVNIPIELTNKQMKDYEVVEEGVVDQLTGDDNSGEKKTALEVILELKRFVSQIKVKECVPIIKDIIEQGEKIVVFSEFQDTAEAIHKAFAGQSVLIHGGVNTEKRDEAVQTFQDPDSDIMVFSGTIGAAGVGLTLTRSSTLLFIGSAWTPADMVQAEDRVHRASTTSSKVTIMTLYCENTIDEYVMSLLQEKSAVVDKAIDNRVNNKKIEKIDSLSQEVGNGSIVGALVAKLTKED
jgi:SWI/SNF-related matrix-associated actin-dependent regulator 1 of chromatin subfamily A